MRAVLLFALAAISSICLANSLEDAFYIGISSHGKLTMIGVRDDYDGESSFPFGIAKDPMFRYCKKAHSVFQCAERPDGKTTVVYKSGEYERNEKYPTNPFKGTGVRHEEAMTYLKKTMAAYTEKVHMKLQFDSFDGYFICDKGCDDNAPVFIFDF